MVLDLAFPQVIGLMAAVWARGLGDDFFPKLLQSVINMVPNLALDGCSVSRAKHLANPKVLGIGGAQPS